MSPAVPVNPVRTKRVAVNIPMALYEEAAALARHDRRTISQWFRVAVEDAIKNQKKHVDEFSDCTLLFTDMVKFTAFSKNAKDPKEVVNLLSKLFSRFDQLCE